MFVAFTEKSSLARVYGKSVGSWIVTFDFKTGETDDGSKFYPA